MVTESGSSAATVGRVFISFASADLELATRVLVSLESAGVRCWVAHRDIEPATPYPAAITSAVEACQVLLVLLTGAANDSPHVLREVELAFNARRAILPVRMEAQLPSVNLQYFLSTTQWLDAGSTFDEADALRLQARLKELLAGSSQRPRVMSPSRRRRGWMIGGGVSATVVAVSALVFRPTPPGDERDRSRNVTGASPSAAGEPSSAQVVAVDESVKAGGAPAEKDTSASSPGASGAAPSKHAPDGGPGHSAPVSAREPGPSGSKRTQVNPRDGARYVWVPPGEYLMGCSSGDPDCEDDEKPPHEVGFAQGFWLGQTEVTEAQYRRRGPRAAAQPSSEAGALPASGVTWAEAKAFCAAIGGRLPSEAEWEYAARAGKTTRPSGPLSAIAWYQGNSNDAAHPVGRKKPNAHGLYDMLGNVAEWVRDRYYNRYYESDEQEAIEEPLASNASALVRGGSWSSEAVGLRLSNRIAAEPDSVEPNIGFRCALDSL
jgi:formylglycine-generating enzyme required for sulfatase activity